MAIAILHDWEGTQDDYDRIAEALIGGSLKSLSDWPVEGILCHIAGPTENGFRVVDVWESEEAFEAFGRDQLFAAFETAGVNPPPPHVFHVHNFVKD